MQHGNSSFSASLGDEGRERPTGGLVDAPSSKAVEEAGHFEEIVLLAIAIWQKDAFLKFRAQRGNPITAKNLRHANTSE
jgi:hypothetical protein